MQTVLLDTNLYSISAKGKKREKKLVSGWLNLYGVTQTGQNLTHKKIPVFEQNLELENLHLK